MDIIPFTLKNPPLDFELSAFLGEAPADFIVLRLDGKEVPFTGTPYDTPENRTTYQIFVDQLNDRSKKSRWPEFFKNWKAYFCKHYNLPPSTTAEEFHPEFSFVIQRTCHGYSEHLHVAIGAFAKLGPWVKSWRVEQAEDGHGVVTIKGRSRGVFIETGPITDLALLISTAVARLCREEMANGKLPLVSSGPFQDQGEPGPGI